MASNIQRGTRGLSAGDITRLKKLNGAKGNMHIVHNKASPIRLEPESGRRVYTDVGGSRIKRTASEYTDYIASQKADYVIESQAESCGLAKSLLAVKVCECRYSDPVKHNGLCRSCTHDRIVVINSVGIYIGSTYCNSQSRIYVDAGTYIVDNQSGSTSFTVDSVSIEIQEGSSTVTFTVSGELICTDKAGTRTRSSMLHGVTRKSPKIPVDDV